MERSLAYALDVESVGLPAEIFCYTAEEAERVPFARRARERGVLLAEREVWPESRPGAGVPSAAAHFPLLRVARTAHPPAVHQLPLPFLLQGGPCFG